MIRYLEFREFSRASSSRAKAKNQKIYTLSKLIFNKFQFLNLCCNSSESRFPTESKYVICEDVSRGACLGGGIVQNSYLWVGTKSLPSNHGKKKAGNTGRPQGQTTSSPFFWQICGRARKPDFLDMINCLSVVCSHINFSIIGRKRLRLMGSPNLKYSRKDFGVPDSAFAKVINLEVIGELFGKRDTDAMRYSLETGG